MSGVSCVSVLLTTLLLLATVASGQQQICGICDCQPSNIGIFSITCDGESLKNYRLTSDLMLGAESTTMMVIKNSQNVNIEKNSFAQLEKFDTLVIQNCTRLHLDTGAFESLNSLWITKVHSVSLGPMALLGARSVKNIIISFSNFTELPKFALFDLRGVEKMSINQVNFGRIRTRAFNISTRSLTIVNSTFNYFEMDGFEVHAQTVLFTKNSFNFMERGAVKIFTEFQTRFQQNRFEGSAELNITSPFVEILENTFDNLQSSSVGKVQMPRFQNNIIKTADLDRLLRVSNHKDLYDNEFECRCGLELLKSSENSQDYQILKKNYCVADCRLALFDFEVNSIPACKRNAGHVNPNDFCRFAKTDFNDKTISGRRQGNFENTSQMFRDANETKVVLQSRFLDFAITNDDASETNTAVSILVLNWLFMFLPLVATLLN